MAVELRALGHVPVPHIVARHISDVADLDALLARLVREAGVDRALVLGGDRDTPAGAFDSALQLIETGLFERHGIRRLSISAYPEGHPRISDSELDRARTENLTLVTTEKDAVRLSRFGGPIAELREATRVLPVDLVFDNRLTLDTLIKDVAARYHRRRIGR